MLNRTNRTQSANFYGLNLGTRTLGLLADGNYGSQTLRTSRAFSFAVVRTGILEHPVIPMGAPPMKAGSPWKKPMPPRMSGSSLAPSMRPLGDLGAGDRVLAGSSSPSSVGSRRCLGRISVRARRTGRPARAVRILVAGASPAS